MMENFSFYYSLNEEEQQDYNHYSTSTPNTTSTATATSGIDSDNSSNNNSSNTSNSNTDKYYLFPSLRPSDGSFCLPSIDNNYPHYTLAVRYTRRRTTIPPVTIFSTNDELFIPSYVFSRLQVMTRKYHARKNQIYSNGMKLHREGNDAWILPNIHVS